jgi:uncharacterized membrane protein YjjP (DUF1212 family)
MSISRSDISLLLVKAGRLLLEYNESTAEIHRALNSTAKALTDDAFQITVVYGAVRVSKVGEAPITETVRELRFNTAVEARVHQILGQVRLGRLDANAALLQLNTVETETPPHSIWLVAVALGAAAISLAALLGADLVAALIAGLATAIGLVVRKQLARRRYSLLLLPLAASLIGAILGGLVTRFGWTRTPGLAMVVPALMVIPGPHLINGLMDLIDNYLPISMSRFMLAMGVLLASAAGIVLGIGLVIPQDLAAVQHASPDRFGLFSVMGLAGVVTCGFALSYNTAWRHLWMAILGGMAGNGTRFLALEAACRLEVATFLGGVVVGMVSAGIVRSQKLPVAAIAFAGAVTMIPGLSIYRAIVGTVQISRMANTADANIVAATIGSALHASVVVGALSLGLLLGARFVQAVAGALDFSRKSR